MTTQAKGSFTVKITPLTWSETSADLSNTDSSLTRYQIEKQFLGDLVGVSEGQMLGAGSPQSGSAGYVAIEKVTGEIDGRNGGFVLQHSGSMNHGDLKLTISVVPNSGTGELAGLAGAMAIENVEGEHRYEFDYTLGTIQ